MAILTKKGAKSPQKLTKQRSKSKKGIKRCLARGNSSRDIPAILQSKNITENGDYVPDEGVEGFSSVNVNVPGSVASPNFRVLDGSDDYVIWDKSSEIKLDYAFYSDSGDYYYETEVDNNSCSFMMNGRIAKIRITGESEDKLLSLLYSPTCTPDFGLGVSSFTLSHELENVDMYYSITGSIDGEETVIQGYTKYTGEVTIAPSLYTTYDTLYIYGWAHKEADDDYIYLDSVKTQIGYFSKPESEPEPEPEPEIPNPYEPPVAPEPEPEP